MVRGRFAYAAGGGGESGTVAPFDWLLRLRSAQVRNRGSGRGDGVHPGDGWMAVLQSSVRHHAKGCSPHSIGTKNPRGDCTSIVLQAYAQGRYTASVVQAPAHLENKMETSADIRGMVVASTCHQGVVLGERRENQEIK